MRSGNFSNDFKRDILKSHRIFSPRMQNEGDYIFDKPVASRPRHTYIGANSYLLLW